MCFLVLSLILLSSFVCHLISAPSAFSWSECCQRHDPHLGPIVAPFQMPLLPFLSFVLILLSLLYLILI